LADKFIAESEARRPPDGRPPPRPVSYRRTYWRSSLPPQVPTRYVLARRACSVRRLCGPVTSPQRTARRPKAVSRLVLVHRVPLPSVRQQHGVIAVRPAGRRAASCASHPEP